MSVTLEDRLSLVPAPAAVWQPSSAELPKRNGSAWSCLIWRERRNLQWWLLATTVMMLCIQVGTLILFPPYSLPNADAFRYLLYFQAIMAPIMFLIGCMAICFALELDEPGFQWTTAMPLRWEWVFFLKVGSIYLGASLAYGIALVTATLIVTLTTLLGLLPEGGLSDVEIADKLRNLQDALYFGVLAAWIGFPMMLIGVLTARTSANGVILGMFIMIGMVSVWSANLSSSALIRDFRLEPERARWLELWLAVAVGSVSLSITAWMFRWRWRSGNDWQWSLPRILGRTSAAAVNVTWRASEATSDARGEWSMLLWLAVRRVGWVGVGLVGLWVLTGIGVLADQANVWILLPSISGGAIFASAFCGQILLTIWIAVQAFVGDVNGEEAHFLAERGVHPTKLWLSRYLIHVVGPTSLALITWVVFWQTAPSSGDWQVVAGIQMVFMLHTTAVMGMLAGQSLRSWQVAVFSLALAGVFGFSLLMVSLEAGGFWGVGLNAVLWSLALPVSWFLTQSQLARWQPRLGWVFPSVVVVLLGLSCLCLPLLRIAVLPASATELAQAKPLPTTRIWTLPTLNKSDLESHVPMASFLEELSKQNIRGVTAEKHQLFISGQMRSIEATAAAIRGCLDAEPLAWDRVRSTDVTHVTKCCQWLSKAAELAVLNGQVEIAEECLRLHSKILQGARPIAGLIGLSQDHSRQLIEFEKIPDEYWRPLVQRFPPDQWLSDLDEPQQQQVLREVTEAVFSFAYRDPMGEVRSRLGARELSTDLILSKLTLDDRILHEAGVLNENRHHAVTSLRVLGIEAWVESFHTERSRREVSYLYRQWQQSMGTDNTHTRGRRGDEEWQGRWATDTYLDQRGQWNEEQKATRALQIKLEALR